jgi:hypothetical protein
VDDCRVGRQPGESGDSRRSDERQPTGDEPASERLLTPGAAPWSMATETEQGLSGHLRGVTVTTLACLAGVIAALVSGVVLGTTVAASENILGLVITGGFVVLQFPILRVFGVDVQGFSAKDYLYVAFMTVTLWFITYTILLTSGVQL